MLFFLMHIPDRFLFSGSRAISLSGMCFAPAMIRSCNAPSVMAASSACGLFIAAGRLLGSRPSPAIPGKLPWPDQTFRAKSDQIRTSCNAERFLYQLVIFRTPVLDQCPLKRLAMRIFLHIDRLHRPRIQSGIVHTGRYRCRSRIKVLHLLRHIAKIT